MAPRLAQTNRARPFVYAKLYFFVFNRLITATNTATTIASGTAITRTGTVTAAAAVGFGY